MARPKNALPNQMIRFTRDGLDRIVTFADLGRLLFVTRKAKNHTLEAASKYFNQAKWRVSPSLISRLENKKLMPSYDMAVRILVYIHGSDVVIYPEDADSTTYQPSSNFVLFRNFISQVEELDASDCEILISMFSVLSQARASIRTVHLRGE